MSDNVNNPKHYTSHPSGVECIQITRHMSFNLGNVIKYLWRADGKGAALEDLKKARWYLDDEIKRREATAPDADGWIQWNGGACPIFPAAKVRIRGRDGYETPEGESYEACIYRWKHSGDTDDIIAYRIVKEKEE
ncbi:DUF3310 domain-containing protein [Herbaspirillum sp. CAH-3]|uniref:DUF3310 domain-containing protein n=1 Tax=Herbaspirillum sp. CAH-3 TaxID=2605746 RepID=UPI00351B3308